MSNLIDIINYKDHPLETQVILIIVEKRFWINLYWC